MGGDAGTVQGDAGNDLLILYQYPVAQGANFSLANAAGTATMTDGTVVTGIEHLVLYGSFGSDQVTGGRLGDTLDGSDGDDRLNGWAGADELTGGGGADRFVFSTRTAGQVDRVTDFTHGEDKFVLLGTAYAGMAKGALAEGAFVAGKVALDAADRILYDAATGDLWHDADGTGAAAAVLFAQVTVGAVVTFADFSVI